MLVGTGMPGWATGGVPHSTGWKRSVNPGRGVEGLGYRAPHARRRQGSFRPPARRRLCSPRGRRRFLAARSRPARAPGGDRDDRDRRHKPCCERPRPARAWLGARSRPQPVGRLRLREARLDVRPDSRPLLHGHDARPGEGDDRPCAAGRRQEGDARLGRRLDRDRLDGSQGGARPRHARPEAEARGAGQAADSAADLHVEAAARRQRQAVPRQDPRARRREDAPGDRRARTRGVSERRRAGGDAVGLAARGAEGAGGRRALVCAGGPREGEGLRPLRRHAQPGVRRVSMPRCRRRTTPSMRRRARSCSTTARSPTRSSSPPPAGAQPRPRRRPGPASRTSSLSSTRTTRHRRITTGGPCSSTRRRSPSS